MKWVILMVVALTLVSCQKKTMIVNTIPDELKKKPIVLEDPVMDFPEEKQTQTVPVDIATLLCTVYFDFDSDQLKSDQIPILEGFVLNAQKRPLKPVKIKGYACPIGAEVYNYSLGERRGNAVALYLHEYLKNEFIVVSFGETELVSTECSGYWKNRRVEVIIE